MPRRPRARPPRRAHPPSPAPRRPESAAPAAPGTTVDVTAILDKLAASNKEKLDWRRSIVDLMKLLNLDSSLDARKTLADELHFTGDKNDFGVDEHLAAQAGHDQACRERRQGARRIAQVASLRSPASIAGRFPAAGSSARNMRSLIGSG